jgi:hypothetical protein
MILTEREHRVLQALAARLFPPDPRFPRSGADVDFAPHVEAYLGATSPEVLKNMKRAIFAFERGAHLSRLTHKPFSKLPPDEQDKYIAAWAESGLYPRRAVFNALRMMLTMIYASRPEIERAVGYAPTGAPQTPQLPP